MADGRANEGSASDDAVYDVLYPARVELDEERRRARERLYQLEEQRRRNASGGCGGGGGGGGAQGAAGRARGGSSGVPSAASLGSCGADSLSELFPSVPSTLPPSASAQSGGSERSYSSHGVGGSVGGVQSGPYASYGGAVSPQGGVSPRGAHSSTPSYYGGECGGRVGAGGAGASGGSGGIGDGGAYDYGAGSTAGTGAGAGGGMSHAAMDRARQGDGSFAHTGSMDARMSGGVAGARVTGGTGPGGMGGGAMGGGAMGVGGMGHDADLYDSRMSLGITTDTAQPSPYRSMQSVRDGQGGYGGALDAQAAPSGDRPAWLPPDSPPDSELLGDLGAPPDTSASDLFLRQAALGGAGGGGGGNVDSSVFSGTHEAGRGGDGGRQPVFSTDADSYAASFGAPPAYDSRVGTTAGGGGEGYQDLDDLYGPAPAYDDDGRKRRHTISGEVSSQPKYTDIQIQEMRYYMELKNKKTNRTKERIKKTVIPMGAAGGGAVVGGVVGGIMGGAAAGPIGAGVGAAIGAAVVGSAAGSAGIVATQPKLRKAGLELVKKKTTKPNCHSCGVRIDPKLGSHFFCPACGYTFCEICSAYTAGKARVCRDCVKSLPAPDAGGGALPPPSNDLYSANLHGT